MKHFHSIFVLGIFSLFAVSVINDVNAESDSLLNSLIEQMTNSSQDHAYVNITEAEAHILLDQLIRQLERMLDLSYNAKYNHPASSFGEIFAQIFVALARGIEYVVVFKLLDSIPYKNFADKNLYRQYMLLTEHTYSVLSEDERKTLESLVDNAKQRGNSNSYDEIKAKVIASKNIDEILHFWNEWQTKGTKNGLEKYTSYIKIIQKASKFYGFNTPEDFLLNSYESSDVLNDIKSSMKQIRPLYVHLHAYLRHKFALQYNFGEFATHEPIPEHLIQQIMWQVMSNSVHVEHIYPFQGINPTVTEAPFKNSSLQIIEDAAEFYSSLGLNALERDFCLKSSTDKTTCPESYNFYALTHMALDYCDQVYSETVQKTYKEMTTVQYANQLKNLKLPYKRIKWPGFVEAVAYSTYLTLQDHRTTDMETDSKAEINNLFREAVQVLIPMHMDYVAELFRQKTLDHSITAGNFNCEYWKMLGFFSGIQPPTERSANDFDAFSRYFDDFSKVFTKNIFEKLLGFQFFEGLCRVSGQYDEGIDGSKSLSQCDYSGNLAAGEALTRMMNLGATKNWRDVAATVTYRNRLTGTALLNYFQPLLNWLEEENYKNNVTVGWKYVQRCFTN